MEAIPLENIFTAVKEDLINVLKSMLTLNPANRCTCNGALQMKYFYNDPSPTPSQFLPKPKQSESDSTSSSKRPNMFSYDKTAPYKKKLNFDD